MEKELQLIYGQDDWNRAVVFRPFCDDDGACRYEVKNNDVARQDKGWAACCKKCANALLAACTCKGNGQGSIGSCEEHVCVKESQRTRAWAQKHESAEDDQIELESPGPEFKSIAEEFELALNETLAEQAHEIEKELAEKRIRLRIAAFRFNAKSARTVEQVMVEELHELQAAKDSNTWEVIPPLEPQAGGKQSAAGEQEKEEKGATTRTTGVEMRELWLRGDYSSGDSMCDIEKRLTQAGVKDLAVSYVLEPSEAGKMFLEALHDPGHGIQSLDEFFNSKDSGEVARTLQGLTAEFRRSLLDTWTPGKMQAAFSRRNEETEELDPEEHLLVYLQEMLTDESDLTQFHAFLNEHAHRYNICGLLLAASSFLFSTDPSGNAEKFGNTWAVCGIVLSVVGILGTACSSSAKVGPFFSKRTEAGMASFIQCCRDLGSIVLARCCFLHDGQ
eukprot:TRINITY_DN10512_c0_g1_i2.p1 TRINITY_DN10512_c0_g1~~TRINITY_DN10512_c0_g1_i2.p1  ORF type:complete len:447 (+),score=103.27 TRINITY_DN10512_c0_g1_i2:250-1590(+)